MALVREILNGIFAYFLIVGAVQRRRNFLLPWLLYVAVVMMSVVICIVACVISLPIFYGFIALVIGILHLRMLVIFKVSR